MQTKHYIPLSKPEGWVVIDFLMAFGDGLVETRAVCLTPDGGITTRWLDNGDGKPVLIAAPSYSLEPASA